MCSGKCAQAWPWGRNPRHPRKTTWTWIASVCKTIQLSDRIISNEPLRTWVPCSGKNLSVAKLQKSIELIYARWRRTGKILLSGSKMPPCEFTGPSSSGSPCAHGDQDSMPTLSWKARKSDCPSGGKWGQMGLICGSGQIRATKHAAVERIEDLPRNCRMPRLIRSRCSGSPISAAVLLCHTYLQSAI